MMTQLGLIAWATDSCQDIGSLDNSLAASCIANLNEEALGEVVAICNESLRARGGQEEELYEKRSATSLEVKSLMASLIEVVDEEVPVIAIRLRDAMREQRDIDKFKPKRLYMVLRCCKEMERQMAFAVEKAKHPKVAKPSHVMTEDEKLAQSARDRASRESTKREEKARVSPLIKGKAPYGEGMIDGLRQAEAEIMKEIVADVKIKSMEDEMIAAESVKDAARQIALTAVAVRKKAVEDRKAAEYAALLAEGRKSRTLQQAYANGDFIPLDDDESPSIGSNTGKRIGARS